MLRSALKRYGDETGRRPTLEFAMMKDINDSSEELDALLTFCSGMLCHVNLIPLNPITKDSDEFAVAPSHKLLEFEKALSYEGIEASIRSSRGGDIDGACGQLRQRIISAGQNR